MDKLNIDFCGVPFINPFILAAAPSTDDREMIARGFDAGWAGAVLKTTTLETEEVSIAYPIMSSINPGPNMVGLHNIDLVSERYIHEIAEDILWLKLRFPQQRVIASLMGHTRADWHDLVTIAEQAGADLIEASISCPQGATLEGEETQGFMVSQDPRLTEKVTRWAIEAVQNIPVYIKISPGVTDISSIARAVELGGGRAICAIDSLEGVVGVDLKTFSPLPSVQGYSSRGGFTGKAIKPIALRCIADIAETVNIPISGVGGIYNWRDALEFMLLGATTVQVCTAVMQRGYGIIGDLKNGLSNWLDQAGYDQVQQIIGLSLPKLTEHDHLPHDIKVISYINHELCIGCGLCYVACADGGHVAIEFGSDRKVEVDPKRCVGCGLCAQVCPVPDCISIDLY
ncbi:MAG: NAD-dependent dihydropyrimidine dehydrogenase subunit PreA [Anaerolineaceae bacterium]|jgi:dihydropyrimidine dehydrogenase (NAD+) subunit PreA|nr:NAD-dependent dihydropyrimidine dehydrogenase subunit PreA [Anaerolineaceae bacterium]